MPTLEYLFSYRPRFSLPIAIDKAETMSDELYQITYGDETLRDILLEKQISKEQQKYYMDDASLRQWFAFLLLFYTDSGTEEEHPWFKKWTAFVNKDTEDARRILDWYKDDRRECNENLRWLDNFVSQVEKEKEVASSRGRGRGRDLKIAADCLNNLHDRLSELELLC